ncbi:Zinc finger protein 385B [Manis javanica]|nr:Zinc finger protein 385B [Manis javanica]
MPGPGRRAAASKRMKGGRKERLPGSPRAQSARDFTCVQDGESEAEFLPDHLEEKPEREKKRANFTLCNVCNIQLNSAAQAQIHYNGKSHQKRLKQLSNGILKNDNDECSDFQAREVKDKGS